jgi:hypothetical protein
MKFRKTVGGVSLVVLLSLLSSVASAQGGGVVGSPHDLQVATGNTSETCVFCHTPHGSDTNAAVPLWNKELPDPTSYTRYSTLGTSTLDGEEAPVGSVSLACLSCHDGSQAVDTVLNVPGSGLAGDGTNVPSPSRIDAASFGLNIGASPVPNLTADLRDDHPVSIQYAGGGLLGSDPDDQLGDPTTFGDQDFRAPFKASVNGNSAWWLDTSAGTANSREKTDILLYTRTDGPAGVTGEPMVECGSCHDPHNGGTAGIGSVAFLRIANDSSEICTTCHIK